VRYPAADGATVTKYFNSMTAANAFAKERRKEIGREGLAFGVIGEDEKAAVQFWRGFVAEVADTPPPPMLSILQDFAETWKANRSSVTVAAAVDARPFPVPMPANAARHSFATFHLLAFRHAGETALQLGHGGSPEMLHRHYKGMATETEAKAFWSIRPGKPANVVSYPEAKPQESTPAKKQKPRTRRKA